MKALQVLKFARERDCLNFTTGLVAILQELEDNAIEEYISDSLVPDLISPGS